MARRLRWAALGIALALAAWFGLGAWTAFVATRPSPRPVPARQRIDGRTAVALEAHAADEVRSVAWFVDARSDRCAILLSGIHGDRRASLPRAGFWLARGWSVLLPDLRGTGESDPRPISFGWNERLDVAAWVKLLRERGVRTIAIHGQSLGAAAAVYAVDGGSAVELLVLDACYDDVNSALEHRLSFVPWPAFSLFPVRLFAELRIGASPSQLRPVECLKRIHTPTFLAVGADDAAVGGSAASAMLEACAAAHKHLHRVEAARHEELWVRDPTDLARALGEFIDATGIE